MRTTICVIFAILLCAQGAASPKVTSDHPTYDVNHFTSQETIDSVLHNFTTHIQESENNTIVNESVYHIHLGNKTVEYYIEVTIQPAEHEIENIAHISLTLDPFDNQHLLGMEFHSGKTIVRANPEYTLPYVVDFKNVTNPNRLGLIAEVKGNLTHAAELERKNVHSYIHDNITTGAYHTLSNIVTVVIIQEFSLNYNFITKIDVSSTRTLYTINTEVDISLTGHAPLASHRGTKTEHY